MDERVSCWREGKVESTMEIFWRGFEMATRVWRLGKAWLSFSSSAHCEIELLLMWSVLSEVWVNEGSKVTVE